MPESQAESSGTTVELVITIKMRQATHGLEVTAWARLPSANGTATGATIDHATGTLSPANHLVVPFYTIFHRMPNQPETGTVLTPGILSQGFDRMLMHALHQMELAEMHLYRNSANIDDEEQWEILYTWCCPIATLVVSLLQHRISRYIFPRTM